MLGKQSTYQATSVAPRDSCELAIPLLVFVKISRKKLHHAIRSQPDALEEAPAVA